MALDDIGFQEGDIQNFLLELPVGTLNSPDDILMEASAQTPVLETELEAGSDIFIMSE